MKKIDSEIFVTCEWGDFEEGIRRALEDNKEPPITRQKEEECSTCKRMKDLGKKCWWCGN